MPDRSKGWIRPYSATLVELNRAVDGVWIIISLWLVAKWLGQPWNNASTMLALFGVIVFVIASSINNLYRSWRITPLYIEAWRILWCWCITVLFIAFIAYNIKLAYVFPRELMWWWFVITPLLLSGTRITIRVLLRYFRVRGYNYRTAAIIGANDMGVQLADNINKSAWMGLRIEGFYDDRDPNDLRGMAAKASAYVKGSVNDLISRAKSGEIDSVYITLPLCAEHRIKELIDIFAETSVSVCYVPDFFVFNLLHAQLEQVGKIHIINVVTTPFLGVSGFVKRLEDIVLSSLILLIIAIPMVLIALAIKLSSPGPVIFRQRRYGLNGKEFIIWKFRTMTVCEDGDAFVQAKRDDSRISPVGFYLRRTSMDELPQFINVLQGRMSIVGPRPHPVALDEKHRSLIPQYMLRHKIRPGITGWAQINGFRGETDTLSKMEKRIQYDIEYIDQWSLLLDFKIIMMTLMRGFISENAR